MKHKPKLDNRVFWPVWLLCTVLLALPAYVGMKSYFEDRPHDSDVGVTDLGLAERGELPASHFSPGILRLYRWSGVTLAMKRLPDGHIHAALASCKMCARQKNPSYAHKNELMCGYCNEPMKFEHDSSKRANVQCVLPEIPLVETPEKITFAKADVLQLAENRSNVRAGK